jgi:hypothetical protein
MDASVDAAAPDGSEALDSTTLDAFVLDAASMADASADASIVDSGPATYHDFGDPGRWTSFDPSRVSGGPGAYDGSAFDGRYLYLVPSSDQFGTGFSVILRYDTNASFTDPASWSTFDLKRVAMTLAGFSGAVFDGHFLYVIPNRPSVGGALPHVIARFDVHGTFTDVQAWESFDITASLGGDGFNGGAFDGRYLYLAPTSTAAARYDTRGQFTDASSWSMFDLSRVSFAATSYRGAVFDGRHVYFGPRGPGPAGEVPVLRYDTQADFRTATSWESLDPTMISTDVDSEWSGLAFDGTHVYGVPAYAPYAVRWQGPPTTFTDAQSWVAFGLNRVSMFGSSFGGAAFDGLYLYYPPLSMEDFAARYDTSMQFDDPMAWMTRTVTPGFQSSAFDGQAIYFIPSGPNAIYRFDARSPRALPSFYSGSFF